MRQILHFPIPNKNCIDNEQIQQNIVFVMGKLFYQLIDKLDAIKYLITNTQLASSINKYMECATLITENQIFMKYQIEEILYFSNTLMYKVCFKHRNFK